MSSSDLPKRPAFQSLDAANEFDRLPFSRMAYVAFAAGLLSLFAAFSTILLPLSMLAGALGIAVVWKLSRNSQMGGLWLAQLGLAMAVASIGWSISARTGKDGYLYSEAAQNAKVFLDTLAKGNKYDALELKRVESARQLTGTDLRQYYSQLSEEEGEIAKVFLDSPLTAEIIAMGSSAQWEFVRGVSVVTQGQQNYVTVEMVNRNTQPERPLIVKMCRQTGLLSDPEKRDTTALWNFEELSRP